MPAKKQRGSAYYENRLKSDFPTIYADLLSKKYASVREAAIAAGLKKETSTVKKMQNLWAKASASERQHFLAAIGGVSPGSSSPVVDSRGYLLPKIEARIQYIMARRRMKLGEVMEEMKFRKLDSSLGRAMTKYNRGRVRPPLQLELGKWLHANKAVM